MNVYFANIKTADGIIAAVVGAAEVMIAIVATNRCEVGARKIDVVGLAEGLAAAVVSCVDGYSQVAQVGLVGDGVGIGASLVGGREELGA